jgi:hypothetical protein
MMRRSKTSGTWRARSPSRRVRRKGTRGQLAPPFDVGEGPVMTPAPTCAGEDPVSAAVPTGDDTSVVAGEPTAEDPAASADPSQVAG